MLRSNSLPFGAATLAQPIAMALATRVTARRGALGAAALALGLTALPAFGQTFSTTTPLPAAVADGGAGGVCRAPTELTISVSGVTAPLTGLSVTLGLEAERVGDVVAELESPGGTVSMPLFSRIGVTGPGFGAASRFSGNYTFVDPSVSTTDIWLVAGPLAAIGSIVPPGTYATSPVGAALPKTPLLATFSGLSTAQLNGNWTVRVSDCGPGDATSITAASLSLTGSAAAATHTITPVASPIEGGSVMCTPNPVPDGLASVCTATPAAGWRLSGISGCGGSTTPTIHPFPTAPVTAACTVTATFERDAATPVPTLGEWSLMLLGLLAAALGMRRLRRD